MQAPKRSVNLLHLEFQVVVMHVNAGAHTQENSMREGGKDQGKSNRGHLELKFEGRVMDK